MCGFRRPVARRTSRLDLDKWPNRMSPLGQTRKCRRFRVKSALPDERTSSARPVTSENLHNRRHAGKKKVSADVNWFTYGKAATAVS